MCIFQGSAASLRGGMRERCYHSILALMWTQVPVLVLLRPRDRVIFKTGSLGYQLNFATAWTLEWGFLCLYPRQAPLPKYIRELLSGLVLDAKAMQAGAEREQVKKRRRFWASEVLTLEFVGSKQCGAAATGRPFGLLDERGRMLNLVPLYTRRVMLPRQTDTGTGPGTGTGAGTGTDGGTGTGGGTDGGGTQTGGTDQQPSSTPPTSGPSSPPGSDSSQPPVSQPSSQPPSSSPSSTPTSAPPSSSPSSRSPSSTPSSSPTTSPSSLPPPTSSVPSTITSLADSADSTTQPTSSGSTTLTTVTTEVNGQLTTFTSAVPTGLATQNASNNDTASRTALIAGVTTAALVLLALALGVVFVIKRARKRRVGWLEAIRRTRREGMGAGAMGLLDGEFDDDRPHIAIRCVGSSTGHSRHPSSPSPPITPTPGPYQHHYHYVHARENSSPAPSVLRASDSGSIFHEEVWPPPNRSLVNVNDGSSPVPSPTKLTPNYSPTKLAASSPTMSTHLRDSDPFRSVYSPPPEAGSSVSLNHPRTPSIVTMLPPGAAAPAVPSSLTVVNNPLTDIWYRRVARVRSIPYVIGAIGTLLPKVVLSCLLSSSSSLHSPSK
ncbi:hypothetical protein BDZ89DRAFT_1108827, partial [Hymenopellis radicata]